MLNIKPITQKTAMCGPACLAMVMGYFGKPISLNRVISASRATRARGLLPGGYRRGAKVFGFRCQVRDDADLADIRKALREGIPPIVNWFSVDEGHYSVVVALTASRITLIDPEREGLHRMSTKVFERIWFGVDPEPARTINDFHLRRLILIRPSARLAKTLATRPQVRIRARGVQRMPSRFQR